MLNIHIYIFSLSGSASSRTSVVSRILPNRPYAAAIPTVLTHDAFHTLCSPPQVRLRLFAWQKSFTTNTTLKSFMPNLLHNILILEGNRNPGPNIND